MDNTMNLTDTQFDAEFDLPEMDVTNLEGEAGDSEAAGLYEHFRAVADKGQELLRIDKFLLNLMPDTSRNRLQMAAKNGFIHVNGKPVKSNYRVKPLDVVTLLLDRPRYENIIIPEFIEENSEYILHLGSHELHIQNGKKWLRLQ